MHIRLTPTNYNSQAPIRSQFLTINNELIRSDCNAYDLNKKENLVISNKRMSRAKRAKHSFWNYKPRK